MSSPAETVLRTLASASLLAFLLALGEGARLLQGSGPGPGELLALVSAGVTTLLPALLCAGLLLGLLLAAAGWTMDLLHVVPGLLRLAVRTPAPRWLGASAGAGAALAAGLAVFQAALGERLGRPNPQDAGLAVACAAVALPAAALLAGTLVASLARRLLGAQGERPWARVAIPLLLLAGGGAVALHVAIRLRPILESIDWRLPLALLLLGASWPILFTILVRAPAWLRLGLRWTAPFSLGALAAFGFFALDTAPAARASLAADRGLLPQLLVRAQALLDHDGDGYSRLLGGGDCDDRDALVHPGGDEVAGNGRDEDCDGEDLPLASTVALAPASPSTTPPGAARGGSGTAQGHTAGHSRGTLQPRYNLVLISVDTLRPDHLGCHGYARDTSPAIDELATRSIRFANAYSTSNKTPSVIGSIISGRYPAEHPRTFAHFNRFLPANVFVAERLSDAGYATWGVGSHWYFEERFGIAQGFQHWQVVKDPADVMEKVPTAERVADLAIRALQTLRQAGQPYFLWLHFLDPHKLYIPHEGFSTFGKRAVDLYDGEIRYTDHHLGRFLAELYRGEDWPRSAAIFISDHGEAFGEHKEWHHGFSLHEHQIRVPLLLRLPEMAPRVVQTRVSLIDLVPTLLDLASALPGGGDAGAAPPAEDPLAVLRGVSLLPDLLAGGEWPPRPIYAEVYPGPYNGAYSAFIEGDLKLLHLWAGNVFSLFDLSRDPGEQEDLFRKRPDLAGRLKQRYLLWKREHVAPVEPKR